MYCVLYTAQLLYAVRMLTCPCPCSISPHGLPEEVLPNERSTTPFPRARPGLRPEGGRGTPSCCFASTDGRGSRGADGRAGTSDMIHHISLVVPPRPFSRSPSLICRPLLACCELCGALYFLCCDRWLQHWPWRIWYFCHLHDEAPRWNSLYIVHCRLSRIAHSVCSPASHVLRIQSHPRPTQRIPS